MSQRPIPGYFKDPQKILKEVKRLVKILIKLIIKFALIQPAWRAQKKGRGRREGEEPPFIPSSLSPFFRRLLRRLP